MKDVPEVSSAIYENNKLSLGSLLCFRGCT